MDIQKYFNRINFKGNVNTEFETLGALHLNHLLNIPFENLDIHIGRKIILDPEMIYSKIVLNNRGGFCYEMNGLFFGIIKSMGFNARMVSARVYDSEVPGPEFDHMAIIVSINNKEYLADVGFGDSFLTPLEFAIGLVQKQNNKYYRIDNSDGAGYIVKSSDNGEDFHNLYLFTRVSRELEEFKLMCNYHQTSPESHFTHKRMCTIAKTDGRITLSGLKQIETKNGIRTETELKNADEFNKKLKEFFGIDLIET